MSIALAVLVEAPGWRRRLPDVARTVRAAARAALAAGAGPTRAELSVVLSDDARVHDLNRTYRRKDKPTNVLSFPAGATRPDGVALLGDVVLAFETCAAEAKAQGKTLRAHLVHLVVHGVLHLLGHDHVRAREAERMEALERTVLARLGIADPYAVRRRAA
jgi:probable rRNA maturation factor